MLVQAALDAKLLKRKVVTPAVAVFRLFAKRNSSRSPCPHVEIEPLGSVNLESTTRKFEGGPHSTVPSLEESNMNFTRGKCTEELQQYLMKMTLPTTFMDSSVESEEVEQVTKVNHCPWAELSSGLRKVKTGLMYCYPGLDNYQESTQELRMFEAFHDL